MDLSQKTVEICKELSQDGKVLEPMSFNDGKTFAGFYPKKKFSLFRQPPIFELEMNYGKPTLTSFLREYDTKIEEIAKKEDFAYNFSDNRKFTLPAKGYL